MYTRILVPVDGSSFSNQMLPLVGTIAKTTGAQLALYRAVEKSDKLADVERELQAVAGQHGAQAVAAEVHGDVADAIRQEADRVPGTLVAITSHGRSGVMRAVLGSTALNVLRAGGDLSKLAAAPQGIVITEPGQDQVETAEADTPKVKVAPIEPAAPQRAPEITPGNAPKSD